MGIPRRNDDIYLLPLTTTRDPAFGELLNERPDAILKDLTAAKPNQHLVNNAARASPPARLREQRLGVAVTHDDASALGLAEKHGGPAQQRGRRQDVALGVARVAGVAGVEADPGRDEQGGAEGLGGGEFGHGGMRVQRVRQHRKRQVAAGGVAAQDQARCCAMLRRHQVVQQLHCFAQLRRELALRRQRVRQHQAVDALACGAEAVHERQEILQVRYRRGHDVAAAVEVHEGGFGVLVAEPVGLDAAWESDGLGCEVTLLGKVVVRLGGWLVQVSGLRQCDSAQLGAEGRIHDISEVSRCAS